MHAQNMYLMSISISAVFGVRSLPPEAGPRPPELPEPEMDPLLPPPASPLAEWVFLLLLLPPEGLSLFELLPPEGLSGSSLLESLLPEGESGSSLLVMPLSGESGSSLLVSPDDEPLPFALEELEPCPASRAMKVMPLDLA